MAVVANVWRTFDYLWPDRLGVPRRGRRVRVPFGRGDKMTVGFVTATGVPAGPHKLKAVAETLDAEGDDEGPFDEPLWKLAEWISHYYMAPLGIVLGAMVPSAVGRTRAAQRDGCLPHQPPARLAGAARWAAEAAAG